MTTEDNVRLVSRAFVKEQAGPDQDLNYSIYVTLKDLDDLNRQIDAMITFAKSHPELLFRIDKQDFAALNYGKVGVIPFFIKAFDVDNIALPDHWWTNKADEEIAYQDGRLTFHGIEKRPVVLEYQFFSNQIRYGVAKGLQEGKNVYLAVHGSPSRNDDYFVLSLINEAEYHDACRIYAPMGSQNREVGDRYEDSFITGHTTVFEGWGLPDVIWL